MAMTTNNPLLAHVRGKFGNCMVIRQYEGKTVVSATAKCSTTQSAKQQANRTRFSRASALACKAVRDPELREHFLAKARRRKLTNAYTMAVSHYMIVLKASDELEAATSENKVATMEDKTKHRYPFLKVGFIFAFVWLLARIAAGRHENPDSLRTLREQQVFFSGSYRQVVSLWQRFQQRTESLGQIYKEKLRQTRSLFSTPGFVSVNQLLRRLRLAFFAFRFRFVRLFVLP